jgi:hypothetical protein
MFRTLLWSLLVGILVGLLDGILSVVGFNSPFLYYVMLYLFIIGFSAYGALEIYLKSRSFFKPIILFFASFGTITGLWAFTWMFVQVVFAPANLILAVKANSIGLGAGQFTSFSFYILSTIFQLFGGLFLFRVCVNLT